MKKDENYTKKINKNIENCYNVANDARKKGYDPEKEVNIPLAKDMGERVVSLVSVVVPQVVGKGIPQRIKELENEYGKLDWRVAFKISLETTKEKFCKFKTQKEAIETGIRLGIAYLTLGVVASPIEGFVELKIRKRADGKEYFALMYAGPIRSAGGTAGAVSVVVADYLRKNMGFDVYDPTEKEIRRTVTELYDYHERVTNLQYLPSQKEIRHLASNIPVQIDGDPSEEIEVSNYKDLERIETNRIRSGACLVMGECVAQKAAKVNKQLKSWGKDFGLEQWEFLNEFLKIQKEVKSKSKIEKKGIAPVYTYIQDLVAGRPVLGHPSIIGGFRLRYGRARTSGYSGTSIHPATMHVLNKYLAIGTQLKLERPGKATTLSSCESIEGPTVKLNDGSVIVLNDESEAKQLAKSVKEIIFLGDILISFGDFFNRAHVLAPAGYCEEWWVKELIKSSAEKFGHLDYYKLSELTGIEKDILTNFVSNYFTLKPDAKNSIILSKKLDIPLHPSFTYHWKTISRDHFLEFLKWFSETNIDSTDEGDLKIILPKNEVGKRVLELIGVPHKFVNNELVVLEKNESLVLSQLLNLKDVNFFDAFKNSDKVDVLELINSVSKIKIRDKSGIFIGSRMGRPEKAKVRKMDGDPHTLFPIGKQGGKTRSFQNALEAGFVESDFPTFFCENCKSETVFYKCEKCDKETKKISYCNICGVIEGNECKHGKLPLYKTQSIPIKEIFKNVLKKIGMTQYPDLIKGVRGTTNKGHIPEHFAKGILRSKYGVPVNKDGTTRYDMTQQPITHFKPKEIGTSIEKLKKLGYTKDMDDLELTDTNQILELNPQDIILPNCEEAPEAGADKVLLSVSKFIDDLLVSLYGLKKFYNFKSSSDLAGHLVVALAPHTSAGIVGRIIGFSKTQGFYAHPLFHAATRRDCDGDEASVTLLMDALLNFSKQFLPGSRGATQDAPLVLTSILNPNEVDDMAFDLDIMDEYPLKFYESTLKYESPWNVDIDRFVLLLDDDKRKIRFTHPVQDMNSGVKCSSYKTIPSMQDKLLGQMDLADKIRCVDASDVARLVIEKHLLRDIKGNLRKFSTQRFRCSKCSDKYRRPPLAGKCKLCGGRIIFTVSEGSIVKYLEPAISLSNKYNLPPYLKQTLELTKNRVEGVFGKEKDKQEGLNRWFG
jgi:DNA polymerase II large subunit